MRIVDPDVRAEFGNGAFAARSATFEERLRAQFPAQDGHSAGLAKGCNIRLVKGMGPFEFSECAGINRHEAGDERALQERRQRLHPDREFCAGRRETAREA